MKVIYWYQHILKRQ